MVWRHTLGGLVPNPQEVKTNYWLCSQLGGGDFTSIHSAFSASDWTMQIPWGSGFWSCINVCKTYHFVPLSSVNCNARLWWSQGTFSCKENKNSFLPGRKVSIPFLTNREFPQQFGGSGGIPRMIVWGGRQTAARPPWKEIAFPVSIPQKCFSEKGELIAERPRSSPLGFQEQDSEKFIWWALKYWHLN